MQRTTDEDLPLRAARPSRSGHSRTLVLALCALLALPGCRAALAGGAGGAFASAPSLSVAGAGGLAPVSRATGFGGGFGVLLLLGPLALPVGIVWIAYELLDAVVFQPVGKIAEALGRSLRRDRAPIRPRPPAPRAAAPAPAPPVASPAPESQPAICTHDWPVAGLAEIPARPCAACEGASSEPQITPMPATPPALPLESGAREGGPGEPR